MKISKKVLALALSVVMLLAIFSGCKDRGEGTDPQIGGAIDIDMQLSADETIKDITPNLTEAVAEKKEINDDTVGWLQIPYTVISDVVVQGTTNQYYERLNFDEKWEFAGVYYADKKCDFGDGSREALPVNTTIYGHALTDNPEESNYSVRFAPLHDYQNINFASENLYMFFSTDVGNYVYEIFSVFIANSDNENLPYNIGDAEKGKFHDVVRKEILPRSIYDYGVEITDDDKFLTLSTCIYVLPDGTLTNYPNTYMRYVVMGRLVEENAPLIETKAITVNEDRVVDPDGPMHGPNASK